MRMDQLPTPCYVIDEKKMRENLECHILKRTCRTMPEFKNIQGCSVKITV